MQLKHQLHQQHIANRPRADAQQGIPFPDMKQCHHGAADGFGDAEGGGGEVHVLQAVDHQHAHDGVGQDPAQIGDDGGRLPVLAEDQEGDKSQCRGDQGADRDGQNGVGVSHGRPPFRSSGPSPEWRR